MTLAVSIPVPISCEMCGGRPFVVSVPMRTIDGLTVDVDSEYLRAAVRAHVRQHQN